MDNSSYRNLYIEQLAEREGFTEKSAQAFQGLWNRIQRFEKSIGKTLEDGFMKEDYIKLFSYLNIMNVPTFLSTKSRIRKYLERLEEDGMVSQDTVAALVPVKYDDIDTSHIFELNYFKDFQSLQDTIVETLVAADKVDDSIYATQIAAIYMAWCGLQLEEALSLMKSDVKDDCIVCNDKKILPNSTIMEYMKDYRDATEYESAARTIIKLKYIPSEYLFRTARSAHVDTPRVMRIFIRNFGKSAGDENGNMFHYDKVYWSGQYHRAYLYESENGLIQHGDIETISRVFNEKYDSVSLANKRLQAYNKYKQYFFPSK